MKRPSVASRSPTTNEVTLDEKMLLHAKEQARYFKGKADALESEAQDREYHAAHDRLEADLMRARVAELEKVLAETVRLLTIATPDFPAVHASTLEWERVRVAAIEQAKRLLGA